MTYLVASIFSVRHGVEAPQVDGHAILGVVGGRNGVATAADSHSPAVSSLLAESLEGVRDMLGGLGLEYTAWGQGLDAAVLVYVEGALVLGIVLEVQLV